MTSPDPQKVLEAAQATIPFLPSATPLEVRLFAEGDPQPSPEDLAITATLVGTSSADFLLVASELVQDALAGAEGLTAADALRPALEAAATVVGTGVLDAAEEVPVGETLTDPDWVLAVLVADDAVEGWFGVRGRGAKPAGSAEEIKPGTQTASGLSTSQREATPQQRADSMRLLYDVEMTLTAEIGRTKLAVRDVLDLTPGSVIELDRSAGSPADVMVNGRLIARGEIVVVDEEYGIRITEIVSGQNADD
ncbi:MAG: flagellar motor switch protein FliN [Actinomycetaceae bacterium]|nr:flagellar motor switch protein FliN [Actinomycetaceae bacterium]